MSKEEPTRPPRYTDYVNPLLDVLKRLGGSARPAEVCPAIAKDLSLPDSILSERLENGVSRFENQVHWARFYLAKAAYIDASRRGVWSLTEKGRSAARFSDLAIKELVKHVQEVTAGLEAVAPRPPTRDAARKGAEVEELTLPGMQDVTYREQLLSTMK